MRISGLISACLSRRSSRACAATAHPTSQRDPGVRRRQCPPTAAPSWAHSGRSGRGERSGDRICRAGRARRDQPLGWQTIPARAWAWGLAGSSPQASEDARDSSRSAPEGVGTISRNRGHPGPMRPHAHPRHAHPPRTLCSRPTLLPRPARLGIRPPRCRCPRGRPGGVAPGRLPLVLPLPAAAHPSRPLRRPRQLADLLDMFRAQSPA